MKKFVLLFMMLMSSVSLAFEDPTEGKPFIPWLFQDQLVPTIKNSYDMTGLSILATGAAATVISHQYDRTVYEHNYREENLLMDHDTANFLGWLGNGQFGIAIAVGQLFFDQENGVKHSRAIILTAANHIALAALVGRERPSGRNDLSFPSGHASSAFATAGSLAYSYGWKVGIPAYLGATAVSISRVNENIHWLSDVVAGAALGVYWAHASAVTPTKTSPQDWTWMPSPMPDGGLLVNFSREF